MFSEELLDVEGSMSSSCLDVDIIKCPCFGADIAVLEPASTLDPVTACASKDWNSAFRVLALGHTQGSDLFEGELSALFVRLLPFPKLLAGVPSVG